MCFFFAGGVEAGEVLFAVKLKSLLFSPVVDPLCGHFSLLGVTTSLCSD